MPFVYDQERRQKIQTLAPAVEYQAESTFGETYTAAFNLAVDEEMSISGALNREGWRQRNQAVRELADQGEINLRDYTDRRGRIDYDRLAVEFDSVKSQEVLEQERIDFLAQRREEAQSVLDRGSGTAQFLGYASAFALDPINLATLPVSTALTGARSLSWFARGLTVARNEAALSVAAELAIQPLVYQHKSDIESPYSWQDAVANIGLAAIGSAGLGFVSGGVAGYLKAARQKIEPFADPVTEDLQLRSLQELADYLDSTKKDTVTRILDEEYGKLLSKEYEDINKLRRETQRALKSERRRLEKEDITVLRKIADMGGLNQEAWFPEGVDPVLFTRAGAIREGIQPGKPLFRKNGGMRPDRLAEALAEDNVFGDVKFEIQNQHVTNQMGGIADASRAVEYVMDALSDRTKPFRPEVRSRIEQIDVEMSRLETDDIDVMDSIYKDAQRAEIDADLESLRQLHINLEQMNQPSRVPESYFDPKPQKVAPQTLHERERAILDEMGIADEYDEAMEAYARTEKRQIWDETEGVMRNADEVMEELDDEIEGLNEVLRCTIDG